MFEDISFITYGRCRKNKDWYIAPLPGVNRIYYIHSGNVLYCNDIETRLLRQGMAYIFPQNLSFKLLTDGSTDVDHTFFDFFSVPAIIMDRFIQINPENSPLIKSALQVLIELASAYPVYSVSDKNNDYYLIKSYVDNFLTIIRQEIGLSLLMDAVISDAVEYIHNNFQKNISILDLAQKYNLDANTFIRKFKKHTGTTPYRYIKNHRMSYAASLIKIGDLSLDAIAEITGYSDQAALSHAVKSTYGVYPKDIKNAPRKS